MSKNQTIVRRFVIILQVILQLLLLLPWLDVSTGKCNAIVYAVKVFSSGDTFNSVKEGLSASVNFSLLDEQAASQLIVLFLFEIIVVLLVQIMTFVNLLVTICKKHVLVLDVICLFCGLLLPFSMINGFIFANTISNFYPLIIFALLLIEFLGVRILEAVKEANEKYIQAKERDKELRRERKRRLAFPGKYTRLFYQVFWKNFKANKKDYIIFCISGAVSTGLIFAGIGMSEILSPLNQEGNLLRGHGIGAILLNFLIVSFIIALFLIVSILLSYLRKRSKNYGIFVNLGLRKMTLYKLLGIEIASAFVFTAIGGILVGKLILFGVGGLLGQLSEIGNEIGKVSVVSYLAMIVFDLVIFGIALLVIRDFYLGIEVEKTRRQAVEREKLPGKYKVVFLGVGILLLIVSVVEFTMRRNAEGIQLLVLFFIGLFLVMKNGGCIFLLYRQHHTEKKYYASLIRYNTFYYRYKTTVRYLFFVGIIPISILFLFSKELISSQIAQEPKSLFPYDFMLMATEEDDAFFEELKDKYEVEIQSYPMIRVSNVDNTETPEEYRENILPQGQHIGVSESTYYKLNKAVGNTAEKLNLSEDGSNIYIMYQQDKSVKAHPLDYLFSRAEPYLHIGQPVESYGYLFREQIFPKRKVAGEEIGILTGAYRRGDYENIVVFSDNYFSEVQDSWKTTNWRTGRGIEPEEVMEEVTIHHYPTRLTLMNVADDVYENVEKELQRFKEKHAFDETFDSEVLSYYSSRTQIKQMNGERFMTMLVNILIICALQLTSLFIIYLKYESEIEEKQKRRDFLLCIGMRYEERVQVLKTEVKVYLWMPILTAALTVPVLTKIIWELREYTKEDCLRYSKFLAVLALGYILLQTVGVKLIETYLIRKVEGRTKGSRTCK